MNKKIGILQQIFEVLCKTPNFLIFAYFSNKMQKSRKGFVVSYMVDFYAYLVFGLILIAFFALVYWAGTPISGDKLKALTVPNDLTTVLIKALQMPIQVEGIWTTPAEIISKNDVANAESFKIAMKTAIETSYPKKKDIDYGWLRVYKNSDKIESGTKIYKGTLGEFLFAQDTFSLEDSGREDENTICTKLKLPLADKPDFVIVVLCFPMEYFK